jgi:hypothetical protein
MEQVLGIKCLLDQVCVCWILLIEQVDKERGNDESAWDWHIKKEVMIIESAWGWHAVCDGSVGSETVAASATSSCCCQDGGG